MSRMHRPSTRTVPTSGADVHIMEWGDDGIGLLALHPGVGDSRIWSWCAPAWAEAGYHVVAYDRRGFGATGYTAQPHDDLDDLLTVTQATNCKPAVVVGNSKGGGLALDLALGHPDHVTALVLIAPSPTGYDDTDWPTSAAEAEQDELLLAAEEAGDLALVNRLEVRYWLDGVDQPEGRVGGRARDLMLEMNGQALRAAPIGECTARQEAWYRLGELAVPVLVIVGEYDLPGIRQQCGRLAAAVPSARLVTMADTAHCPSLDRPSELSALVIDFLAEVS